MELHAFLFLLFSSCIGAAMPENPKSSNLGHPIFPNLRLVATVDGKSFFADNTGRTWQASKTYCNSLGMKLASITSKAQFDALHRAFDVSTFNDGHWTAGRDAQIHRQFSWDATNQQISNEYLPFLSQNALVYKTCILFFPGTTSGLKFWHCDYPSYKVLCET